VTSPALREAIPGLVSQAGSCIQGALALAAVRGDERSLLGGAAIATLHDSLCGVLRLLNTEAEWCADLITRSMIEAYAHAAGLALQPGYERRMALESHCKQSELYRDLGIEDAPHKAEWHSAQAEILRKAGVERLSIRDRFRAAEIPRDFKLIYADLTAGAHSDYVALITKHVGNTGVRLGSPMTDYALVKSAWVSTALAHGGAVLLPHFADVDLTALQEALAPLTGIEDGIQSYREEALRRQHQSGGSVGQS
jgi:hypothetical protein